MSLFVGGTGSANELDDYEEGTFTPSIGSGYSYANTITYANQTGNYTKIGNVVYAQIYIQPNGNSAHSGNLMEDGNRIQIDGLGYTQTPNVIFDNSGTAYENLHAMPWIQRNQSYVYFHNPVSGGTLKGNNTNPTNRYLIFQVRYFV